MVIRPEDTGGHLDPLEVAEHAEGLLEPERAASVAAHLSSCAECRDLAVSIGGVTSTLAAAPAEIPIPDNVAARIDAALADEAASRTAPATSPHADGFWSRLRGRLPAVVAAAASVAVLGLVGYVITEIGGDDTATTSDAGAGLADSDESGEAPEATMNAPEEAEEEAAPDGDESAERDSDGGPADARDDAGEAMDGDAEQFEPETFGDDVPARERDALTAQLQDILAGRQARAEPGQDGAPCGTALSEELGGQLIGAADTDLVEPGSVLVAIDLGDEDVVTGWVLPDCTAGPDDALTHFKTPSE